jgi:hypothetical protein
MSVVLRLVIQLRKERKHEKAALLECPGKGTTRVCGGAGGDRVWVTQRVFGGCVLSI